MKFPAISARDSVIALVSICLLASLSGCASPGPVHPPSLHLPNPVTDLSATRTGNEVTLGWTTPDKTTDGLKIQPPLTADICRELPTGPSTCTPVKHLSVSPGASEAVDLLPPALSVDPATLLTYRIQILNRKGHSAGPSNRAFAAAGSAPSTVEDLKVTPIRNGALIEWRRQSMPAFTDLDRNLVQTGTPKKPSARKPRQLSAPTRTEVHLQAGRHVAGPSADTGGTVDPTAQKDETYRYTAQRVRAVTLDGHALEIRSIPSAAVTVVLRDTFPPHTPTGLVAAPGNGSIDLSWEPDIEADLAGYIVYRQTVAADGTLNGTPTRLIGAPTSTPAFSDRTAVPGQMYSYRVAAIDAAGNVSTLSAEARESLRSR